MRRTRLPREGRRTVLYRKRERSCHFLKKAEYCSHLAKRSVLLCWALLKVAMELVDDRETKAPAKGASSAVIQECYQQGVVVLKAGTYDNVIRLLPPLTIDDALLEEGLSIMEKALALVGAV